MNSLDRDARVLYDALMTGRRASFTTGDPEHRRRVLARLQQMLSGDLQPSFGDPSDD